MSDNKIIQPTFPMSEEEHDKYVDLAWNNGKVSIQEQRIREIISKNIMNYHTGIMVAPTNDIFLQKIGVHFRFSDTVEAIFWAYYNLSLTTFYAYKVQKFTNNEEGPEIECKDPAEVNLMLNKWLKVDAAPEDNDNCYKCEYCTDGRYEFGTSLFVQDLHFEGIKIADIDIYITDKGSIEMLVSSAADEPIAKKILPAKYCPMCGRKFGGNHDS